MSAESVTYALLSGAGPVTSVVGTRIYPIAAPLGTVLPLITYEHISSVRLGRLDAASPTHPVRTRVQVNLLAADVATLKNLRAAVTAALQFQRGAIGGSTVISVLPDVQGPDSFDAGMQAYHQPLDFLVTHLE